jgi:hypothetical protein
LWSIAALAALLAPARSATILDGIPLDTVSDAVLIGMAAPLLALLDRRVFDRSTMRALVALLAAVKLAGYVLLTPGGLCSEFRTPQPVGGSVANIDLGEPTRQLHSWDARARWDTAVVGCSALTRRDYPGRSRFPAWFLNVVRSLEAPPAGIELVMHGFVTVAESGTLSFDVTPSAGSALAIDRQPSGRETMPLSATLAPGSHHVELRALLTGDEWRLVPSWNGRSLWSSTLVTVASPSAVDGVLAPIAALLIPALAIALVGLWTWRACRTSPLDRVSLGYVAAAAAASGMLASIPATARFAPLAIALTVFSPAARDGVRWLTAVWLIGVPWWSIATSLTLPRVGEFMLYSRGDDWLTYQVSAYRIYLHGYWLEAGEKLFYYQPLYRWIAGALHMVFGDSSGGETLWDSACLLAAAILAFVVCRAWLNARAALAASVLTLAQFALTPIWYLVGRGLADVSAAGFAWTAALLLIRARRSNVSSVLGAGVCGVLAYYARLNQVLFVGALATFLVPLTTPASALRRPRDVLRSVSLRRAATYGAVLMIGVALFALRSWFYTGQLNPFAGTSFALNHTGLAPTTVLSPEVWRKVSHSLFAQMIVNEVFDVRGLIVYAGCVAGVLAVAQVPVFAELPLSPSIAIVGGLAGALLAHAHGYPGRFAVHLVPLATSIAVIAAVTLRTRAANVQARRGQTLMPRS